MKVFRIINKNIKDSFKSIFRNMSLSFAAIICTTITLLLVGISIILNANIDNFTKDIEKDLTIVVFMKRDATNEQVEELRTKLSSTENISTILYESKEDIKNQMMLESDVFTTIMSNWTEETNPLQNQFTLKVDDVKYINKSAKTIESYDYVDSVQYGEGTVEKLVSIFDVIEKCGLVMVIALVIVTIFLIGNTIKLTIYSRKTEIEIMRLVGTSNAVIKLPFIIEGFLLGLIGSILPIIISIYGYVFLYNKLDGILFTNLISLIEPFEIILYIALFILILGCIIGMLSSYRAVRKYLKI